MWPILVLADRAVPYLLARVRWPDVAQAISVARPDWLDDPGLFDLPYDRSAVKLSFSQAASVAASWGRQLQPGAAEGVPSYIRRMPANWSDLSPSERRAWGIEFVGTRNSSPRRVRRSRRTEQKIAAPPATVQANGHAAALEGPGRAGTGLDGPAANGSHQMGNVTTVATERRGHVRVPVDGRAHIRCGNTTISAGLVDVSEKGLRCVLPDAPSLIAPGPTLDGPFLLEAEVISSRICLDAAGQISWHRRSRNQHALRRRLREDGRRRDRRGTAIARCRPQPAKPAMSPSPSSNGDSPAVVAGGPRPGASDDSRAAPFAAKPPVARPRGCRKNSTTACGVSAPWSRTTFP